MSSFAPSPQNPYVPVATRTRVRWENIAIVLTCGALAAGAVTYIMSTETSTPKRATAPAAGGASAELSTLTPADAGAAGAGIETTLTREDAQSLVDEARSLMLDARWDEATDRLTSVPEQFRAETEADAIAADLASKQARWKTLGSKLEAQVAAGAWREGQETLTSIAAIARLDDDLLATKTLIESNLAPAATPAAKEQTTAKVNKPAAGAATAAATTGGGAATSAAKPAAAKPATAKPAATPGKPATNATTPSSTSSIAGLEGLDTSGIDPALLEALLGGSADLTLGE